MKIAMVGTGYVGLVSGACFSEFGWDVVCVDLDAEKIKMLEAGEMPIYEPRLDDLVARNVAGRLLANLRPTSRQRSSAPTRSLLLWVRRRVVATGMPT